MLKTQPISKKIFFYILSEYKTSHDRHKMADLAVKICKRCDRAQPVHTARLCYCCYVESRHDKRCYNARISYIKRHPDEKRAEYFFKKGEPPLRNFAVHPLGISTHTPEDGCQTVRRYTMTISLDGFTDWRPARLWGFDVMNVGHHHDLFGDYVIDFECLIPVGYPESCVKQPRFDDELGG